MTGKDDGKRQSKKRDRPKRIFLFSDGTGNAASTVLKTNVWRLYQALEKGGEQKPQQVALYDNGVGTSSFRPIMLIAGIFGFGLRRNIIDLYRFLCLQYEEGAEIYLIGFSRGAFTMRLLAALVKMHGIVKVRPDENGINAHDLDRFATIAIKRLSSLFPSRSPIAKVLRWGAGLFPAKSFSILGENASVHFDSVPRHSGREIRFMGLFETVSAYGGPVQEFTDAFAALFFPIEPKDWSVGGNVLKVCHALALDEPRHSFWPKLINEAKDAEWDDPRVVPETEQTDRIEQVWFAGAHANVGGGYANDGLSMIPLNWMIDELRYNHNARFDEAALNSFEMAQDCCAPLFDPRDGTGFIYRYNPRNLSRMTEDPANKIYTSRPKIHHSVFDRMIRNPDYAPIAINRDYEIVDAVSARKKHPELGNRKADFHLNEQAEIAKRVDNRILEANGMNPLFTGIRFNRHVEAAWNTVWKRRVVFAVQLMLMLVLIGLPVLPPLLAKLQGQEFLYFLGGPVRDIAQYLPNFTLPWAAAFAEWPTFAWTTLGLFVLSIVYGRSIKRGINSSLVNYWHYIVGLTDEKPSEPEESRIFKLRNSRWYRYVFHRMKHRIMTVFFGALILGVLGVVVAKLATYFL